MTQALAETGAKVVAIEKDRRLEPVLAETLSGLDNVSVVIGDALEQDLNRLTGGRAAKVVANLPYYVTTPILMKLLESHLFELLVVLVQREVAQRLAALPGGKEYGALSVMAQHYSRVEITANVKPGSFYPAPTVVSSVVRCTVVKPEDCLAPDELLGHTVRAAFGQRRKVLGNALQSIAGGASRDAVYTWLHRAGVDPGQRAEQLSPKDFAALANAMPEEIREWILSAQPKEQWI
jgi:16S rRNA (adenine1518-N6/adenine1519-N6)-dimethyltransferase